MIYQATKEDRDSIAILISSFRVELLHLKKIESKPDIESSLDEFDEYIRKGYPIYFDKENDSYTGYLVCRVEDSLVWVESIYVEPKFRRNGIASALFEKAEELSHSLGGDMVYNYVHPNNLKIISFLAKRGYDVLNLIEIRKPYADENFNSIVKVFYSEFRY